MRGANFFLPAPGNSNPSYATAAEEWIMAIPTFETLPVRWKIAFKRAVSINLILISLKCLSKHIKNTYADPCRYL